MDFLSIHYDGSNRRHTQNKWRSLTKSHKQLYFIKTSWYNTGVQILSTKQLNIHTTKKDTQLKKILSFGLWGLTLQPFRMMQGEVKWSDSFRMEIHDKAPFHISVTFPRKEARAYGGLLPYNVSWHAKFIECKQPQKVPLEGALSKSYLMLEQGKLWM